MVRKTPWRTTPRRGVVVRVNKCGAEGFDGCGREEWLGKHRGGPRRGEAWW